MIKSVPPIINDLPMEFDAETHSYRMNGHDYSSVTTVLEATGLSSNPWATDAHRDRGTMVHTLCSTYDESQEFDLSDWDHFPDVKARGSAYMEFKEKYGIKVLVNEKRVCSVRYSLAGTLDKYAITSEGELVLIDIKSGKPGDSAWIQTALYQYMLGETSLFQTGKEWRVDRRIVLWLKANGSYDAKLLQESKQRDCQSDLNIGLSATTVYNYRKTKGLL